MHDFAPPFPRPRHLRDFFLLAAGTVLAAAMILSVEWCFLYAMTQPQP